MSNVVGIDLGTTNSVAAFKFAAVEIVTASDNAPPERTLTRSLNLNPYIINFLKRVESICSENCAASLMANDTFIRDF